MLPPNRGLVPKPDDAEGCAVVAAVVVAAAEDGFEAPNPNPELPNEPPNAEKPPPALGAEAPKGDDIVVAED